MNADVSIERPNILGGSRRKLKEAAVKNSTKDALPVNCAGSVNQQNVSDNFKSDCNKGIDSAAGNNEKASSAHVCSKCSYCSDHLPKTEPVKKFPCNECKEKGITRIFSTQAKLDLHKSTDHVLESSTFVCKQCDDAMVFSSKTKYKYHLHAKHPYGAKFFCDFCFIEFKLKVNYKAHLATHNVAAEKKYTCDVCNGTFVTHSVYESHIRRFPGPHIKHVCNICGISFSHEKRLKNHRCKKLLLEQAEARLAEENEAAESSVPVGSNSTEVYRLPEPEVVDDLVSSDVSEQLIIKDVTGQSHVLRFDIHDDGSGSQPFYQVNVADWNMVAPYVIRETNCQQESSSAE